MISVARSENLAPMRTESRAASRAKPEADSFDQALGVAMDDAEPTREPVMESSRASEESQVTRVMSPQEDLGDPEKVDQDEQQQWTLDKPKIGNRAPFYPRIPMPYHPEEIPSLVAAQMQSQGIQMPVAAPESQWSPELGQEVSGLSSDFSIVPAGQSDEESDDAAGVMAQSYGASVAVYPVKQIAKDAVPEEVKEDLNRQGLWNVAPMVVAQPSPKLDLMNQMVQGQMKTSSVPVSKPVARFMASMENELGVTNEKMLKAFEQLSPGDLSQSPEVTLNKVVENLNLPPADESKARELYTKLVTDLRKEEPAIKTNLTSQSKPESLDKMLSNGALSAGPAVSMKEAAGSKASEPTLTTKGELAPKAGKIDLAGPIQSQQKGFDGFQSQSESQGQSLSQEPMIKTMSVAQESSGNEKPATDTAETSRSEKPSFKKQSLSSISKEPTLSELGSPFKPAVPAAATDNVNLQARPADLEARAETVKEIANQAQILSHKGGGEVKMTLNPEHLGEIQLKVVMDGGRVDVQMVADKQETKKLLEQNFHELKQSLASHNISVDRLDVSVQDKNAGFQNQRFEDQAAKQFGQYSQQQQQQQGRYFGQNQGSQHRGYDEVVNSGRSYRGKGSEASVSGVTRRGVSSGRLNVVA